MIEFRCSSYGHLMVGAQLAGQLIPLGKTDQKELDNILKKQEQGKPLTPNQETALPILLAKRDTPFKAELSPGAKTYIEEIFINEKAGYMPVISSIQMEHGDEVEQRSIRQVGAYLGYPMATKAVPKPLSNGILCSSGYDWAVKDYLFDQKNVWEPKGLKSFEKDKDLALYIWQVKGYLWLTGRKYGAIIRCLMNPSESILLKEAKQLWVKAGYDWNQPISDEFLEACRANRDFESRMPIEDRIRIFKVELEENDPALITQQVTLANEYWQQLEIEWQNKNQKEYEFFKRK